MPGACGAVLYGTRSTKTVHSFWGRKFRMAVIRPESPLLIILGGAGRVYDREVEESAFALPYFRFGGRTRATTSFHVHTFGQLGLCMSEPSCLRSAHRICSMVTCQKVNWICIVRRTGHGSPIG